MAGIGKYQKGKAFQLKSGNKPTFRMMGSSPLKAHDGTKSSATHFADGTPKSKRDKFNDAETQNEISKLKPKTGSGADSTEGQDQNKIFDDQGNHIGNWKGNKKVLFKSSPAKRADVYIDGENIGTGPEAMKKGIAQEKKNIKVDVGFDEAEKAVKEGNLKEVTYDKEDAKTRLKMATTDPDKKGMVKDYKTTGIVKGKGTERAEAAKSRDKA